MIKSEPAASLDRQIARQRVSAETAFWKIGAACFAVGAVLGGLIVYALN